VLKGIHVKALGNAMNLSLKFTTDDLQEECLVRSGAVTAHETGEGKRRTRCMRSISQQLASLNLLAETDSLLGSQRLLSKGGRTRTESRQASRHEKKEKKADVSVMTETGVRRVS
jgi:hypothetical protein